MEESNNAKQQSIDIESKVHKHSKIITGFRTLDGNFHWTYETKNLSSEEDENIEVRFFVLMKNTPTPQKEDALRTLLKQLENIKAFWFISDRKEWVFDLDQMKAEFQSLQKLDWFTGRVYLHPEFEVKKEGVDISNRKYYHTYIVFYINRETLGMSPMHIYPPEIQNSLREFRLDHPDPKKSAFIMMRFGNTSAHNNIVRGIKDALTPYGINAIRADDKEWHSDLFYNVLTCLYGCSFGIAVFERIEQDDFNPNVSLEVGYTMALGKQVCLLKDQTLKGLHTDLVGKLYKTFDPQNSVGSIPPALTKWMKDKKII